jgi:hypothetical protein
MAVYPAPLVWLEMLFEFLIFPITVLVAGSLLSHFKPNHRRVVGVLLIAAGILELVYYLARYPFHMVGPGYFMVFLTTFLGIVVVFMSSKYAK